MTLGASSDYMVQYQINQKKQENVLLTRYSKREPLKKKGKGDLEKEFFCFKLLIKWFS